MWIGIVVVLWPCEWKVTGSNLGRQKLAFIFTKFSLEWMWKGRENLALWEKQQKLACGGEFWEHIAVDFRVPREGN